MGRLRWRFRTPVLWFSFYRDGACVEALSRSGHGGYSIHGFSLFVGVSMSVTAFPVLSRIFSDLGLNKTSPLGITVLTCAAGR